MSIEASTKPQEPRSRSQKLVIKDAQLQLSYINITAPSSGRIGRKSVEIGQRVQPGSPLMAVVGTSIG